jgi:hypothetical protein
MQPSMDEWRELYEAAVALGEAAPWQWMWDSDQFGVQDPESGEIGYGCVMGRLGEHFALAVYRGSEGLAGLWRMREAGPRAQRDPAEVLSWQNCLMASFEDRALVEVPRAERVAAVPQLPARLRALVRHRAGGPIPDAVPEAGPRDRGAVPGEPGPPADARAPG